MPRFRSIAEFLALTGDDAPTEAERLLVDACREGEPCELGDGERPESDSPARRIRADLLALLITGGTADCDLHPSGIILVGAWVGGELDLRYRRTQGRTALRNCTFTHAPQMVGARCADLDFTGSDLPGLSAIGLRVAGTMVLREVTTHGTTWLQGASISGQLICDGAIFDGNGDDALNAQGAKVNGSLFLRGVTARGTVAVGSTEIGGQVSCNGDLRRQWRQCAGCPRH